MGLKMSYRGVYDYSLIHLAKSVKSDSISNQLMYHMHDAN